MKKALKLGSMAALLVALSVPSLFAESRHRSETNDGYGDYRRSRAVTIEGRVRDIDRERNGFVIELDRTRTVLFTRDRSDVRYLDRGDYVRVYGLLDARGVLHVRDLDIIRQGRSDRYDSRRDDRRERRW